MENVYRNQTNTLTKIQMISTLRITTVQEAVAYLRAMAPINDQIATILSRSSVARQQEVNRAQAKKKAAPVKETETKIEPAKTFEPEDLTTDEGYTEKEAEEKVEKLKAAKTAAEKAEKAKEEK